MTTSHDTSVFLQSKGLLYGLKMQINVINALISREVEIRYGSRQAGYLWALLEPGIMIVLFGVMHGVISAHVPYGENILLFMFTGVVAFRLAMMIAGTGGSAIGSNQAVLSFPHVKPIDAIIARAVVQTVVMLLVSLCVLTFVTVYTGVSLFQNPYEFFTGLLAAIYLGFGIAFFNAVFFVKSDLWSKVYGFMSLPLMITSGLFYLPASMPAQAKAIFYYNPFLHIVEWVRGSMYVDYIYFMDKRYPLIFASIALALGLIFERSVRGSVSK